MPPSPTGNAPSRPASISTSQNRSISSCWSPAFTTSSSLGGPENLVGCDVARAPRPSAQPQRVVGIGASAGGLEALKQLFAQLPVQTGLAYVVLQHLPTSQTGKLAAILAKVTSLPVVD